MSTDVGLGVLHKGDTLAYVYTLTAEGTTHGFERGYDAFLGDPFGVDVITDNLSVTVATADVPQASTSRLMLLESLQKRVRPSLHRAPRKGSENFDSGLEAHCFSL